MKIFVLVLVGAVEGLSLILCGYSIVRVGHWVLTKLERRTPIDRRDQVSESWLTDQEQGRRW